MSDDDGWTVGTVLKHLEQRIAAHEDAMDKALARISESFISYRMQNDNHMDEMRHRVDNAQGQSAGARAVIAYLIAAATLVISLLLLLIANGKVR